MTDSRSDRQRVIRSGVGFAVVAAGLWSTMVILDSNVDSPSANRIAEAIGYLSWVLNFVGAFLTFLIQLVAATAVPRFVDLPAPVLDLLSWAWCLVTVFIGAFVQGIAYGAIGLAGSKWCRRRRRLADGGW